MKRLILLILLLTGFQGFSQTRGISYQAVILSPSDQELPGQDASGNILANTAVSIQFTIVNASAGEEFKEYHRTSTDEFGLINLLIGTGTSTGSSNFTDIVWDGTIKKLKVGIDFSGGTNFSPLSEQNLTYMPQPINEQTAQVIAGIIVDQAILKQEISEIELVPGEKGEAGSQGIQGEAGVQGPGGQTGAIGPMGAQGSQGPAGVDGINGINGSAGSAGAKGDIGASGIQGQSGPTGPAGAQGIKGDTGASGSAVAKGDSGAAGMDGTNGADGTNGTDGKSAYEIAFEADNTIGDEATWLASLTGDQGIQGSAGAKGDIGVTGIQGQSGPTGPAGVAGINGDTGAAGAQGIKGDTGASGSAVAKGDIGAAGMDGTNGADGTNGVDGLSAYEVYAASNVDPDLNEAEWLASLVGAAGVGVTDGLNGTNGTNGADGADGADGISAYQAAVNGGFTGTEAEWLLSINGANGINGTNGADGTNGVDGLSAYEVYAASNVDPDLSVAEWLVSLVGAAGVGVTDGLNGTNGTNGADGADGADGISAYQAAVNGGFTGTEAEWLLSINGANGINGTNGADGTNGKSAYEIAFEANNTIGDEASWLAALKGATGDQGVQGIQGIQGPAGEVGSQGDPGATGPAGTTLGDMQYWNGSAWVIVPSTRNEGASLQSIGGIPTWVGGTPTTTTAPGAVSIGTATAGDSQATVTFTAPASNGGATITGYTVTSSSGGGTATGASSPITITGLANGTAYTFTVTATNSVGTGAASVASNSVTPAAVPAVPSVTSAGGKIWMDRNLGATQVATISTDQDSYGDLYQWGRGTDGHQLRISGTRIVLSSTDQPGHGDFILAPSAPNDWLSPQNNNLWQGVDGVNNPCPSGYRLPTQAELDTERLSWDANDAAGAFASPLKLPVAGFRNFATGSISALDLIGFYWSSRSLTSGTTGNSVSAYLRFDSSNASTNVLDNRARGMSVRCLKELTP